MLRKALLPTALALVAFAAAAGSAHAASFPCAKAAQADEIAICANRSLNDADVEMATRYEMVLALLPMGGAGALRDGQRIWLQLRQSCGGNVACISNAYSGRIATLKSQFAQIASGGPY